MQQDFRWELSDKKWKWTTNVGLNLEQYLNKILLMAECNVQNSM